MNKFIYNSSVFLVVFFIASATVLKAQSFRGCPTGEEDVTPVNNEFEKEVLRLVNIERESRGLAALTWNEDAARAARYHAADMAQDDYFAHASQDGTGVEVCGTFERIGKFVSGGAENIAAGSNTPEAVMNQWMNSKGHKENILSEGIQSLGVGYYHNPNLDNDWSHYWVQVFSWDN